MKKYIARCLVAIDQASNVKNCTRCRRVLPFDAFYVRKNSRRGYHSHCKACQKDRRALVAPQRAIRRRQWRENNKELNRRQKAASYRRQRDTIKAEWMAAYGGCCTCCGENRVEFMTVEHLNGGGRSHRAEAGAGIALLRDLKRRGWPKDQYTMLCCNCNCAKGWFGECPHEREEIYRKSASGL